MNIQTYWDLSERDRAELSREDVERYADVELMTKGVLRVDAPKLEPVPQVSEPDVEVFSITAGHTKLDIAFATAEQARAFVALKPMRRDSHYVNGSWIRYVNPETDWGISADRECSKELADLGRDEFRQANEVKARNLTATEAYQKALTAQQEALSDMWNDWHRQQGKAHTLKRVVDTLESYTLTASGDRSVAFRFLRKAFSDDMILEAIEWFEFEVPQPFTVSHGRIEEFTDVAAPTVERASL
jgi:hypothetical protein